MNARLNCSTPQLLQAIESAQAIQKAHPMDSEVWKAASRELRPLFAEMAARQAENGGEVDHRKWKWYV